MDVTQNILSESIVKKNKKTTPWGPLGYITYKRTYSRKIGNGDQTEEFDQSIERIIKACRTQLKVGFTEEEEKELFDILFNLECSVAGRFWWQLGTKTVDRLGLLSLQNCAFTLVNEPIRPFVWTMDALMLGSGVGYNIQREHVGKLPKLKGKIKIRRDDVNDADFIVPDSREGWIKLLAKVLKAHFYSGEGFSYSTILIRSNGAPIKSFGGTASGPEILCTGIEQIHEILNSRANKKLRPIDCLDIMNIIGSIVVAGNVRRSAQIAIGDCDDVEFLKAKRWDLGTIPNWRAMSNNSVVCDDVEDLIPEFWQTYQQGEPYGLINLKLARKIGRIGETQYSDPEIGGFNPCQPDFATVLTKNGIIQFKDLNIGDEIWSREGWTKILDKWSTGIKSVYATHTTGGVFIGTLNHKVETPHGKIEVDNSCSILTLGGNVANKVNFDTQIMMDGLFLGDGYHKLMKGRKYTYPCLVIGKDDHDYFNSEISHLIKSSFGKDKSREDYNIITTISKEEKNRTWEIEIPDRYYLKNVITTVSFLRGLYSADGSVVKQNGDSCRVTYKSSSKKLIRQIQQMLSSIGIRSYYTINKEKVVKFSNGEYVCKQSYDLNITKDVLIFADLIGFIQNYKNEKLKKWTNNYKPNNKNTFTSKVEVEYLGEHEVFDITVDNESHTYWTGGLSVSNCAEQGLADKETCCLADIFLPLIKSKKQLFKVATYLYRICKHSLMLPCHLKDTEEIVHKNMRMGIGITGVYQATAEQRSWLSECYEFLREYDKKYSAENGFPVSIKLTTVKPSGTLSLLPGITPGAHPSPAGPYYIRRIRIATSSHLIQVCRNHGYFVEFVRKFDGSQDRNTCVVEFPCKVPDHTPIGGDLSAVDQLEFVKEMQTIWSDNSVSVTVYYKKEEIEQIKQWLKKNYEISVKTVSFLLYHGHGFDQAPYETISKEKYDELIGKVKPITSVEVAQDDMLENFECEGGSCPIK